MIAFLTFLRRNNPGARVWFPFHKGKAPPKRGLRAQVLIAEGFPFFRSKEIRSAANGSAARHGKPRRSGASTSWKEIQDEAYQRQQQIVAVLRLRMQEKPRPSGRRAGLCH